MEELRSKIKTLFLEISKSLKIFDLENKKSKLGELKNEMTRPDFWNDQERAKNISWQASVLEKGINDWQNIAKEVAELNDLSQDQQAEELLKELENKYNILYNQFTSLAVQLFLQGKYD